MTHPAGTIILPLSGVVRYPQFVASMLLLEQPEGTTISMNRSPGIADNVNASIAEMNGDWIWLLADDHAFPPDTLMRLLDCDVDIVVPVCFKRTPPFHPVLYRSAGTKTWAGMDYPAWEPVHMDELPAEGLATVDAAGGAGMLIREHVLQDIGEPWFENTPGAFVNEDVLFCMKAREAGYKIHVAVDVYLGHLGDFAIWPTRDDSYAGWRIDLGNNHEIKGSSRVPVA